MRPAFAIIRSSSGSPKEIWRDIASAPRDTARSTVDERTFDRGLAPKSVLAEIWTTRPDDGGTSPAMNRTMPGFARMPENGIARSERRRSAGRSIPGNGPAGGRDPRRGGRFGRPLPRADGVVYRVRERPKFLPMYAVLWRLTLIFRHYCILYILTNPSKTFPSGRPTSPRGHASWGRRDLGDLGPRTSGAEELAMNRLHGPLQVLAIHGERVGDHRSARGDELDIDSSFGDGSEDPGGDAVRIPDAFPDETDEGSMGQHFQALHEAGRQAG